MLLLLLHIIIVEYLMLEVLTKNVCNISLELESRGLEAEAPNTLGDLCIFLQKISHF